jgi:hypothetical protein
MCYSPVLLDSLWYKKAKLEKYTKWLQNIPNGRKMYQKAIKYTNNFHSKPSKIYPNWYENIASGNPASHQFLEFCPRLLVEVAVVVTGDVDVAESVLEPI